MHVRFQVGFYLALGLAFETGAASAQTVRTLADGRTASVGTRVANCRPGTVASDNAEGLHLEFACRVSSGGAAADTDGTGQLVILGQAGARSPAEWLTSRAIQWWPDFASWPQDRKNNAISRTDKALATGPASFMCLHRDNVAALEGDAICVLSTPVVQLVAIDKSTMALTADNVVDAMLAGVRLR